MTTINANSDDKSLDYDAEVMKEEIADDKTKAPSVNIEKDYERSKQLSTPERELPAAEISPSLGSSFNPENKQSESSAEGNPENFRTMAQEISPEGDSQ
jgi:hypothetical protein